MNFVHLLWFGRRFFLAWRLFLTRRLWLSSFLVRRSCFGSNFHPNLLFFRTFILSRWRWLLRRSRFRLYKHRWFFSGRFLFLFRRWLLFLTARRRDSLPLRLCLGFFLCHFCRRLCGCGFFYWQRFDLLRGLTIVLFFTAWRDHWRFFDLRLRLFLYKCKRR